MEAKYESQEFDESEQTIAPYPSRKEAALRMMDRKNGVRASCALVCASCANPPRSGQDARTNGLETRDPLLLTGVQSASLSGDFQAAVDDAPSHRIRWHGLRDIGWMGRSARHAFAPPPAHKTWMAPLPRVTRIIEYVRRSCRARRDAQPAGGTPHPARDGLIQLDSLESVFRKPPQGFSLSAFSAFQNRFVLVCFGLFRPVSGPDGL